MNNINWKLRLQNKTTLLSIIGISILIIFTAIGLIQQFPNITPEDLYYLGALVVEVLGLLGIVVDPTTEGVKDSVQAMDYNYPKKQEYVEK